ncbi:MAG: cytochrome c biogenesis protein CcsA [Acidobacteriota bacterium]
MLLLRLTLVFYFLAALSAFVAVLGRPRWWRYLVPSLIGAGCATHIGALSSRALELGHCPLHTTGEVVSFLSLAGMLIYLLGFYGRGWQTLSVVLLPLSLVLAVVSNLLPAQALLVSAPGLERLLMTLHIGVSTLGVAALFLTLGASLLYLWQEWALKHKSGATVLRLSLPSLETCDSIVYRSLVLGFMLMTLGILTVAMAQAMSPSNSMFLWNRRETFALLAWAIFAVLLTGRLLAGWRGRKAAYLVIVGVAAVLLRMVGLSP